MIRLTIITVNLNNKAGLQKTVESVFAQTFREFEYIIVDGASVDGSIEEIRKIYNPDYHRFKVISEPDSGVYEAMNKGIRAASGQYLLFLNSGDFLVDEHVLQEVFKEDHSADFLLGKCHVSENGKVIWTSDPPDYVTFGFLYTQGLAHQSTFIKKDVFLQNGLYNENFRYNADIEYWYRTIILKDCTTARLSLIVSDYNKHGISHLERENNQYKKEKELILSNPMFRRFIPDYDSWSKEQQENQVLYWAKSKKNIYFLLQSAYRFTRWFAKIRK